MTTGPEYEFEIDQDLANVDLDDGEQNLEDEANEILHLWDEGQLKKEVNEERDRIKLEKERKYIEFYDGETSFDDIVKSMEPLEGGKVFIKFLERNPEGQQIFCDSNVMYDHASYLEYKTCPFESSHYDGKPAKVSLLDGPIIVGMLQAFIQMREGERANILLFPEVAYGKYGALPLIPSDSKILCQVKVHKVWSRSRLEELLLEENNYEVPWEAPLDKKIEFIEEHKNIANNYLRDGEPRDALVRYKAAIKYLDEIPQDVMERCEKASTLMTQLLQNAANALNQLEMYKSASKYAKRALFIDPRNLKAYYQLIKARIGLNDYSGALMWLEKVDKISPSNTNFAVLKLKLDKARFIERQKSDEIMLKMASYFKKDESH